MSAQTPTATEPASTPEADRVVRLKAAAQRIRGYALHMGEAQGQGYIGQALGVADILAVACGDQLRFRPEDPHWEGRDRFLLSIGHYAIALYAALAEAGTLVRRRTLPSGSVLFSISFGAYSPQQGPLMLAHPRGTGTWMLLVGRRSPGEPVMTLARQSTAPDFAWNV